jgi:hypothetical protein
MTTASSHFTELIDLIDGKELPGVGFNVEKYPRTTNSCEYDFWRSTMTISLLQLYERSPYREESLSIIQAVEPVFP